MDVLFLDANVLFSAAYREQSGLLKLWQLPKVTLVSSSYALEEAKRNLNNEEQQKRLKKLTDKMKLIMSEQDHPSLPEDIVLAGKDRPILSAALAAKADYLITGDYKDFGRYFGQKVSGVLILPPSDYFKCK